jgi:hypothetical protein
MLIIRSLVVGYSLESDRVGMIGLFRLEVVGSNDRIAVCAREKHSSVGYLRHADSNPSRVLTNLATSQSGPPYFPNRFR